jgi:hypothetical protein
VIDAETRAAMEALVTEFSFRVDHGEAAGILEYEDLYVRGDDGQWLFASRKAIPVLPPTIQ